MSTFNFGTNLGLTGGKYLIKVIFYIQIEIGLFEISSLPNFNKSWGIFNFVANLCIAGSKYLIKITFDFKSWDLHIWNMKCAKFKWKVGVLLILEQN